MKVKMIRHTVIDGRVVYAGQGKDSIVDVSDGTAVMLLHTGKAEKIEQKKSKIPPPPKPPQGQVITEGQDPRKQDIFSKMSKKELLKLAEEKGIKISKLKKAEKSNIIALLKEHENSPDEEGGEDHDEGTEEEEQNKEAGNGDKEPD